MSKTGIAALKEAGRGEDSLLVHMAPKELAALQQMAVQQGGSLTVNPKTGLPEVGFLSSMLPALAGAVGGYFGGPWGAAAAGALTGAVTGDQSKGTLMNAGLGALGGYGGGNLASGVLDAGGSALAQEALTGPAQMSAENEALRNAALQSQVASSVQPQTLADTMWPNPGAFSAADNPAMQMSAPTPGMYSQADKLQAGLGSIASNPLQLGTNSAGAFNKDKAMKNAAALAPLIPGLMQPGAVMGTPGIAAHGPAAQSYNFTQTPLNDPNHPGLYNQWYTRTAAGGGLMGMAQGGIAALPPNHYAAGGKLLQGAGTGLSDDIPATIVGTDGSHQKAALADGEFVVSADVVSALGDGSTKAGAQKLYALMDRVRQKAHGTTKQTKRMPAGIMPA